MATVTDGRKANGGARPGAGRKPVEARDELARLLDKDVPVRDRSAILVKLSDLAQAGDIKAITLLLAYLYGRPVERQEIKTDQPLASGPAPIQIIFEERAPKAEDL